VKVDISSRFEKAYSKITPELRVRFEEKLRLLVSSDLRHPSLRIKKIKGVEGIYEASIDMDHRFTFEKIEGGIRLRVIGPHKVVERP
jgi:mRNA interferase RelE/StbE